MKKLLDLYCGAGLAAIGYKQAGRSNVRIAAVFFCGGFAGLALKKWAAIHC